MSHNSRKEMNDYPSVRCLQDKKEVKERQMSIIRQIIRIYHQAAKIRPIIKS
jgi:hypothetical protein